MMIRIVCGVAYDGKNYSGWQRQLHASTIQSVLEDAISRLAMHAVSIVGAGRTDQGVHASYQVFHFDTYKEREFEIWKAGVNYHLPSDIRLLWVKRVPCDFHARFSATERAYRYQLYQGLLPFFRQYSWMLTKSLDIKLMQIAAQDLIGEHDFSALRAAQCQANSPIRHITHLRVFQKEEWIYCDIKANAFLHHMVRNILGVLVDIGLGKRPKDAIPALLATRDRRYASRTAPPQGLYLCHIQYPKKFEIPCITIPSVDN